ncbi:MAG TPA: hypothetical protein VGL07_17910 [Buttiauxella sp.]|jgi:hypothetical protein
MVIEVDSQGNAKVAKWKLKQIAQRAGFRLDAAREYRQARGGGMRYYRRACIHDDSEHMIFDGEFYDARVNPPQVMMPCPCCYAEWLFGSEEVKEAIAAINKSVDNE